MISSRALKDIASVVKLRLSLPLAASALFGYLLRPGAPAAGAAGLFFSVLALSAGAGCLNNWQDRTLDRALARTRSRPLPAGRIGAGRALALAVLLLAAGLGGLLAGPNPGRAAAAGALAVLCYNAIYTPMKPRTLYALAPGIACGVLPPLIGWLAAGGGFHAGPIWTLMTIFGLWQPPHFWLLVLAHQEDYRTGPVPSMLAVFSQEQLARILFMWVVALAMALLALPLAAGFSAGLVAAVVLDACVLVAFFALRLFARERPGNYRSLFAALNLAVFLAAAAAVLLA